MSSCPTPARLLSVNDSSHGPCRPDRRSGSAGTSPNSAIGKLSASRPKKQELLSERGFSSERDRDVLIFMEGAFTAIIAVVGTLLGSVVTYRFQLSSSNQAEQRSFRRQLRSERVAIYSDFGGAITDFRRAEHDWWNRNREDAESRACFDARQESYRLRGVALHALFRVQLITDNETLFTEAQRTYELTTGVHKAGDSAELAALGGGARNALERFVSLAASDVQRDPAASLGLRDSIGLSREERQMP